MRRLYLQIYLTIIGSLMIVVILAGLAWNTFGRDRFNRDVVDIVGKLTYLSLPSASAPPDRQQAAIDRLSLALQVDLTLFSADRALIGASGDPAPVPKDHGHENRWRRGGPPRSWALRLPDGRYLVADLRRRGPHRPLLGLIALLAAIALGVGIGAYPLVRRLTRRLERLQRGVEKIGSGALDTRIEIAGRDEIAQLANSFNEAAEKIQSLLAGHRMLLANASHELRTPLSRIRLGIELLQSNGDPTRKAALELDIAELDTLIDEILLMSRLDDATHLDLGEDVDLVGLLAEECARYEGCSFSGQAPPIKGDAKMLRRLVRNLLENAGKHGVLPAEVEIRTTAENVVLRFTDQGPGIAEAEREKVFQPFYRAAGKQNLPGSGLGLPLVRQIAEAHGGTATIVDTPDHAASFEITLPLPPA